MCWPAAAFVLLLLQNPDFSAEGLKALEAQKYELAAQYFSKAVQADSSDYAAHFHLALANSLTGKDEEAIAGYRKVLELKPGLYEAELNLGMVLLRRKRAPEALPLLQAAVDAKPKEFRPRLYLADALFDSGEFAKAAAAYRAALELNPKSAPAELGLARSEVRAGNLKEAEAHFRKAAELDAAWKDAMLELAPLYEKNGQAAEAIALYRQFPDNVAARERLGQLLLESGNPAEAIPLLEWAVAKSPTAANRLALAQAYRKNHQPEKELPLLEQAVAAEPDNLDLRMAFGRELRDQRKFAEAAREFQRVIQARPASVEAWNEFAAMLISLENFPQALAALDRIKALGAEGPGHHFLRAIILDRLHDLKGALASYQSFLATDHGKSPNEEFKARQRIRIIENELHRR
jgi:tetratricopeptide (TPR) repeat protein